MAAAEEGPGGPLQYQGLALKVSIHCEGCKKKVKKVLQSIEGVYKTDIDIQKQKVVVIGNVAVDELVKKLVKTGKHAEPWPEPAPPPSTANPPGGKKKKKKSRNKNSEPADAATAEEGGAPPEKHDHPDDEASEGEPESGGGGGDAHDGGAGMAAPLAMTPHGQQPIAPSSNTNGGGGGKKKKKKKKGGNGNGSANGDGAGAGATVDASPNEPPTNPAGTAIPHAATMDAGFYSPATSTASYPGYYAGAAGGMHMPASPPYAMRYSTAHPLRSSAYYHPMVGATYGGHLYSTAAPVSGSYYMFSEENANACSVM